MPKKKPPAIILPNGQVLRGPQCAEELDLVAYSSLVGKLASRYKALLGGMDEAFQVGFEGLLRARDHWDPHRGPFGVIANFYIRESLNQAAEVKLKDAGLPHNERPSGIRHAKFNGPVKKPRDQRVVIFSGNLRAVGAEGLVSELFDLIPDPTPSAEDDLLKREELSVINYELLARLPARDQLVIRARYFQDQTLGEVAATLGVSFERVRQIEKVALLRLRGYLTEATSAVVKVEGSTPSPTLPAPHPDADKGVCTTIKGMLSAGSARATILRALQDQFPHRDPHGMASTLASQISRIRTRERRARHAREAMVAA